MHKIPCILWLSSCILLSWYNTIRDTSYTEQTFSTSPPIHAYMSSTDISSSVPYPSPWFGLCSPYGGVTLERFFHQLQSIPELRMMYRDLNISALRTVVASHDTFYYALYTTQGIIGWTQKTIRVHAGEVLLTDRPDIEDEQTGFLLRGYCCNRLSRVPRSPVLPPDMEPPEILLGPPYPPPIIPIEPPLYSISPRGYPLLPPEAYYPPESFTPRFPQPPLILSPETLPPLLIPEPHTFLLFITGICLIFIGRYVRNRKM